MTGKPATKFNIEKRGILGEGYYADIVIFDPEKIEDKSTMEEPYQYPVGISHVFINGRVALEEGVLATRRLGVVLRQKKSLFSW